MAAEMNQGGEAQLMQLLNLHVLDKELEQRSLHKQLLGLLALGVL